MTNHLPNPRKNHELVPFGAHAGAKWSSVDESYLYYIARRSNFLGKLARTEIRRRCSVRGSRPPIWTDEQEEVRGLRPDAIHIDEVKTDDPAV